MSDICTIKKSTLDGIAKAIQSKTSESDRMLPSEMAGKIEDLPSQPAKGLVFSEYDSDGYPHKAEFVGSWLNIPNAICYYICVSNQGLLGKITSIRIPDTVTKIGSSAFADWRTIRQIELSDNDLEIGGSGFQNCRGLTSITFKRDVTFSVNATFRGCTALTSVTFGGDIPRIANDFNDNTATMLYDFSHATAIPSLYSVASLGHASGCVIKIPSALSDQTLGAGNGWESATNWSGLTNIVWEAV